MNSPDSPFPCSNFLLCLPWCIFQVPDEFPSLSVQKFSGGEKSGLSGNLPKLFGFRNNLSRYIEALFVLLPHFKIYQNFPNSSEKPSKLSSPSSIVNVSTFCRKEAILYVLPQLRVFGHIGAPCTTS